MRCGPTVRQLQSIRLLNQFNSSQKLSDYFFTLLFIVQTLQFIIFLNRQKIPLILSQICSFRKLMWLQHYNMKNIELYRTIEALVESKKQQYTPNKPSFAHEYCKKQIQKKKLIPYNPKSKMSKLMKNFHQLDTYVNVEQLLQCINQKICQKKKEDKPSTVFKWKSKQKIVFDDEETIDKVRQKLGPYNQRIYIKENQQMHDIIQRLQEDSNVASYRKRNSPWTDHLNFYHANSNVEEEPNKFSTQKQKWRYYQGNNYVFDQNSQKRSIRSQIFKIALEKPSLKKRQQKMDLIHQVSTYLQIILENHHKKKWGKSQVKVNQHAIPQKVDIKRQLKSAQKEKRKKVQFQISRPSTRYTDHKSTFQRSVLSSQKTSLQNSVLGLKKSNSNISIKQNNNNEVDKLRAKKVGVNENFTFRNRNIKQNLMKKINKFLQFVESEQKQFKKQKNYEISELDILENKEKINDHNLYGKNFMVDDYELKAVQNTVHMQK